MEEGLGSARSGRSFEGRLRGEGGASGAGGPWEEGVLDNELQGGGKKKTK